LLDVELAGNILSPSYESHCSEAIKRESAAIVTIQRHYEMGWEEHHKLVLVMSAEIEVYMTTAYRFFPIYNPKYARLYSQSRKLGTLPPHIFAIADVTYHNMLRIKESQCVVISGESGSGKTESTNHLISHLTSLSQKGSSACTSETTLLNAGPVLEAFGNAVTLQNNNSSRFGKFIKINYRENGMVSGNYHVFYYLLEGASEADRAKYFLLKPQDYHYLNQRHAYHSDENAYIENEEVVDLVAQLLNIKTESLLQALTMKRHVMKTETVVTRYSVSEAINTRDAMAKCLYNALFHWIVLRINQALMRKDVSGSVGYYIGGAVGLALSPVEQAVGHGQQSATADWSWANMDIRH
ncbi:myosin head, partial [Teladorsagia circumcincta]